MVEFVICNLNPSTPVILCSRSLPGLLFVVMIGSLAFSSILVLLASGYENTRAQNVNTNGKENTVTNKSKDMYVGALGVFQKKFKVNRSNRPGFH